MSFQSATERFARERAGRQAIKGKLLRFGVSFIDDSLLGIRPDDLVLVGAPSGVGKTQFCVNVALANIANEKRVHFFALEAGEDEIERRLKFQVIAESFYADKDRPRIGRPLVFDEWETGAFEGELDAYEERAQEVCAAAFRNLFTFYKSGEFDAHRLSEMVTQVSGETDLVIVDHVHYFDWDNQNDNQAIKEIAKTARGLCVHGNVPMILVAHLRKKDKQNAELVAGLDEFHGSSDLTKIATKVITLSPGGPAPDGGYFTYIRTPKNRHSSSSSRFLAQMIFNEKKGCYEQDYKLGWANAQKFGEIEHGRAPNWFGRTSRASGSRGHYPVPSPAQAVNPTKREYRNYAPGASQD